MLPIAALTTLAAALALATSAAAATSYPDPNYLIGANIAHDPSMVATTAFPHYRVYLTRGRELVSNVRSEFTYGRSIMSPQPWWRPYNTEIWAPDVSYHNGRYWMYYAVAHGRQRSAIGVATSPSGYPRTWTDRGPVVRSQPGDFFNAIDPNLLVDRAGRWWLTFGSYWSGLYMARLNPATGKLAGTQRRFINVARRGGPDAIEAGFVFQHGGFYYLFASYDACCAGSASTYNVRVGRSASPTGPFIGERGVPMALGGGTPILSSHGWVRGPGGQSVVHDPIDGNDLLVYHYYDSRFRGEPFLGINYLGWKSNGFPEVAQNPIDAAVDVDWPPSPDSAAPARFRKP